MNATEANAFLCGFLVLRDDASTALRADELQRLEPHVQRLQALLRGRVTIALRAFFASYKTCGEHIDMVAHKLWTAHTSRPPTLAELGMFMRGHFLLAGRTSMCARDAKLLASEIERCTEGLTPGFQALYFYLMKHARLAQANGDADGRATQVELAFARDALQMGVLDFEVPSTDEDDASPSSTEPPPDPGSPTFTQPASHERVDDATPPVADAV